MVPTERNAASLAGLVAIVVGGIIAGCGSGSSSQPNVCDPLATTTLPISAGTLVGAGKDSAGVVYVIDDAGSGNDRLFVSNGMTLQRVQTNGSGSIGGGAASYLIVDGLAPDGSLLQVAVEMGDQGPARMGLHRGPLATKTFAIGTEGELLTLLGKPELAAFSLQNLPGTIHVEHLASLLDGRLLVVTSPDVDATYADFRLFLGPPDHLLERGGVNVTRGSWTQITFTLDGQTAQAVFGSSLAPAIVSQLTVNGESQPLDVAPPGSKPDGATFYCMPSR